MVDAATHEQVGKDFDAAVNMTVVVLKKWLKTDESHAVGQKSDAAGESTGHESGLHIVKMLETARDKWHDADWAHAAKVVSYIKRHLAQRPGTVAGSRWEASLKNWGHQP